MHCFHHIETSQFIFYDPFLYDGKISSKWVKISEVYKLLTATFLFEILSIIVRVILRSYFSRISLEKWKENTREKNEY